MVYILSLNSEYAGVLSQQKYRLRVLRSRIEVGFVATDSPIHEFSFRGSPMPTRAVV